MSFPSAAAEHLSRAIAERTARIGIIGLGHIGLPLAEVFVTAGFAVLGFDCDTSRIAALRQGRSHPSHFSSERLQRMLDSHLFEPDDTPDLLRSADVIQICVPTPLTANREPDLSAVVAATRTVAGGLRPDQLIILESTTYPGTTRNLVQPLLDATGLVCGLDYFLAYSPEREDPGNRDYSTASIPRVVGGIEEASGWLAAQLFAAVVERVVPVSSAEVAEASKILENTYRAVNIALVNELKILYERMGIDVWEVIEAARSKPFGFQAFYPGPGWGGHCIPIDPFYLAWVGRQHGVPLRFVELAGQINIRMPEYVVERLEDALRQRGKTLAKSRICLLGMAYKKDVDDVREAPGLQLLQLLSQKEAEVCYNDPHVPRLDSAQHGFDLVSQVLTPDLLQGQDALLIVTDHSLYDWSWLVARADLVVDTRNATHAVRHFRERIVKA